MNSLVKAKRELTETEARSLTPDEVDIRRNFWIKELLSVSQLIRYATNNMKLVHVTERETPALEYYEWSWERKYG